LAKLAIENAKKEQERKKLAVKEYFKIIQEKGLTKYIGQPEHAKKAMNRLMA